MRTGRLVVWLVILANLAIVEFMFFVLPPVNKPKNLLVTTGQFLGLHAALLMIAQLLLIARLPWLDRRIGMDRLTTWHRWTGFALFWTVLAHPTFILLGYAKYDRKPFTREFTNLAGMVGTLLGMCALATIVVIVVLSIRAARRRLPYEVWKTIHLLAYGAIVLALIHQLYEGSTFKASALTAAYWWTLWALAGVAVLFGQIITPVRRNLRHRLRVAAVVAESDDVVSVHVTGRDLDRLPAKAGQFLIWRFLTRGRWWQANPFSLSAAPDGRSLRLTAKAVGATSAGLRDLPIGARVYVEGPYGAFTAHNRTRDSALLIAGGVGVTPIRALLEELSGPVTVIYRVRTPDDAVLLGELRELAAQRGAEVHLLTGRTGAGHPPNDPFSPDALTALVPDLRERDIYVCGPPAMTAAVIRSLRTLRVPRRQVHSERFGLAASRT